MRLKQHREDIYQLYNLKPGTVDSEIMRRYDNLIKAVEKTLLFGHMTKADLQSPYWNKEMVRVLMDAGLLKERPHG